MRWFCSAFGPAYVAASEKPGEAGKNRFDNWFSKSLIIKYQTDITGSMRFDDALDWYVKGHFSAEDATRASGVTEAAQRLLQKNKIFSPVPQDRTAKRMLFGDTVKRLSIAGELNRCGIPLIPASKMIHADMFIGDFQLHTVD
ncbi:MAG: hypothetical protein ACREDP_23850, partial [Bradyrhizobium sp.]